MIGGVFLGMRPLTCGHQNWSPKFVTKSAKPYKQRSLEQVVGGSNPPCLIRFKASNSSDFRGFFVSIYAAFQILSANVNLRV